MWKYVKMNVKKETDKNGEVTFKPPQCPECKNALYRVNRVIMNYQVMTFDVTYGSFEEGLQHHDIYGRMVCPHCGHYLGACEPVSPLATPPKE
ncbi:MAG: hypothetical protein GY754_30495 [bacterium]|nr:hypothetical protein [bacterium]